MKKKAIILDLDNTIYPVRSIGERLFAPLFDLITREGNHITQMDQIRQQVMRRPFQGIAKEFSFSDDLFNKAIELLKHLKVEQKMKAFEDFELIRTIPIDKYVVTTGFKIMQESKFDQLGIRNDFKEIYIIDPTVTTKIKKDVFLEIMQKHNYSASEVLVIGDDLQSEIKAANELGIEAVLYDKLGENEQSGYVPKINNYKDLLSLDIL